MNYQDEINEIVNKSIEEVLPDKAVEKALKDFKPNGKVYMVAIGKAGYQMAKEAIKHLNIEKGIVITKYGHVKGNLDKVDCYEAGHPISDENTYKATEKAIELVTGLKETDTVVFLISGGGSALFEKPLVDTKEYESISKQLILSGADITKINTIRKRLSQVKAGKFAKLCYPAKVFSIVLSDVLGDPLDMIASGPAYPDSSTSVQAIDIVNKYNITISDKAKECLLKETPKKLENVETVIAGSVSLLAEAAKKQCEKLGYKTEIVTANLNCLAGQASQQLMELAKEYQGQGPRAFILAGETTVIVKGKGLGGRNQQIALESAKGISGMNCAIVSFGSDGTDGPTDAAGGFVTGETYQEMLSKGIEVEKMIEDNDSYHALERNNNLIITGPTGTNVNDVSLLLIR